MVVTREAASITASFADVSWTIPLDARGLPVGPAEPIALTGDGDGVPSGDGIVLQGRTLGDDLYLVSARFDVAFPPALGGEPMSLDDDVVSVPR